MTLSRNLSHYLGQGASTGYLDEQLELSSVPDWQSQHPDDCSSRIEGSQSLESLDQDVDQVARIIESIPSSAESHHVATVAEEGDGGGRRRKEVSEEEGQELLVKVIGAGHFDEAVLEYMASILSDPTSFETEEELTESLRPLLEEELEEEDAVRVCVEVYLAVTSD